MISEHQFLSFQASLVMSHIILTIFYGVNTVQRFDIKRIRGLCRDSDTHPPPSPPPSPPTLLLFLPLGRFGLFNPSRTAFMSGEVWRG